MNRQISLAFHYSDCSRKGSPFIFICFCFKIYFFILWYGYISIDTQTIHLHYYYQRGFGLFFTWYISFSMLLFIYFYFLKEFKFLVLSMDMRSTVIDDHPIYKNTHLTSHQMADRRQCSSTLCSQRQKIRWSTVVERLPLPFVLLLYK